MAAEREETVRRAFEAFAARDLPALSELVTPDVELRPLVSVWQRNYRGLDGLDDWFREVSKTWAEFEFHADEVRELDADRMLIKAHWRGCAVAGGSEVGGPSAAVITFRDDKVVIADFFLSEEAALAAAGSGG
jgi:ketosteroid isomerase-like protein